MPNRTATFIKWWTLLAVLYGGFATFLAVAFGLIDAWSFGMSGSHPNLFRNKLIFPTQLFIKLPERFDISEIFIHALGSGLLYSLVFVSLGALLIKNSK
jgi:hypothetical protein